MAPPTIAILRIPEALPVSGPSSATPKLKIVGNMMELNNPTARMLHIAICPPPLDAPGRDFSLIAGDTEPSVQLN